MNSNHPSSSAGTRGGSAADSTSATRNSKRPKCKSSLPLLLLLVNFSYPNPHSPTPRVFYFGCFHLLLFSDSFRNTWVCFLFVLRTLIFLLSCISGFLDQFVSFVIIQTLLITLVWSHATIYSNFDQVHQLLLGVGFQLTLLSYIIFWTADIFIWSFFLLLLLSYLWIINLNFHAVGFGLSSGSPQD